MSEVIARVRTDLCPGRGRWRDDPVGAGIGDPSEVKLGSLRNVILRVTECMRRPKCPHPMARRDGPHAQRALAVDEDIAVLLSGFFSARSISSTLPMRVACGHAASLHQHHRVLTDRFFVPRMPLWSAPLLSDGKRNPEIYRNMPTLLGASLHRRRGVDGGALNMARQNQIQMRDRI